MKIAVTYDVLTNSIFQHFGKTQSFKVYEIEDGKVKTSAVIDNGGFGHHDLATYLKNLGVETLILGKRGQGPVECEFAVRLLFEALQKEFKAHTFEIKSKNESRFCDGWSSVIFETSADLAFLEGSVEWKCQSYLRPGHKRKNWFVDVSIMPEFSGVAEAKNVEWQFFRCGGNGGQNVNKVETGVRLIHRESGIVITCTEERSQALNRKRALEKLDSELKNLESAEKSKLDAAAWTSSNDIVRGNPVRVYEGKGFKLIN